MKMMLPLMLTLPAAFGDEFHEFSLNLVQVRVQQILNDPNVDVANKAPLTEVGYSKVAALNNDEAMLSFIRRQLDAVESYAKSVKSLKAHGEDRRLISWLSWELYLIQTLIKDPKSLEELAQADPKDVANKAPLSSDGQGKVAALDDYEAMLIYVGRQLDDIESSVKSQQEQRDPVSLQLVGLISMINAPKDLELRGHTDPVDVANEAPLDATGYSKVAALKSDEAMLNFIHRQLDAVESYAKSVESLKAHGEGQRLISWVAWQLFLVLTLINDPTAIRELLAHTGPVDVANKAPLSSDGYQKVAALEDFQAMLKYVGRQVDAIESSVKSKQESRDPVSLQLVGVIGMINALRIPNDVSNAKEPLRLLSIRCWPPHNHGPDVPHTAPLSEEGYQKVAALKDDEAMLKFVRRQLDAVGMRANSTQQLRGWVGWFSGTKAKQSFAAMIHELSEFDWLIPNNITGTYAKEQLRRELRTAA